ncbi:hypothetical protein Landi51_13003 [Colletotrichum acutatum]
MTVPKRLRWETEAPGCNADRPILTLRSNRMFAILTCTPTAIVIIIIIIIIILTNLLPKQTAGIRKPVVLSSSCTRPPSVLIFVTSRFVVSIYIAYNRLLATRANPSTLYENLSLAHFASSAAILCSSRDIYLAAEGNLVKYTLLGPEKYPDVAAINTRLTDILPSAHTRIKHYRVFETALGGASNRRGTLRNHCAGTRLLQIRDSGDTQS